MPAILLTGERHLKTGISRFLRWMRENPAIFHPLWVFVFL